MQSRASHLQTMPQALPTVQGEIAFEQDAQRHGSVKGASVSSARRLAWTTAFFCSSVGAGLALPGARSVESEDQTAESEDLEAPSTALRALDSWLC